MKCSNNYRYAFIHVNEFSNALKYIYFLSSIEIHMLKVTQIALFKYERANGATIRERFLVSKVKFNF